MISGLSKSLCNLKFSAVTGIPKERSSHEGAGGYENRRRYPNYLQAMYLRSSFLRTVATSDD